MKLYSDLKPVPVGDKDALWVAGVVKVRLLCAVILYAWVPRALPFTIHTDRYAEKMLARHLAHSTCLSST